MNFGELCERLDNGEMRLRDIPILAAIILAAILIVGGEVGCFIWFFIILISAIGGGATKLLMLIPCAIIFSILSAFICFVAMKIDDM